MLQLVITYTRVRFIQAVTTRGGRFLEAPVIGSRQPAMNGQLLILAAGDRTLFDDCYSCLEAMGRQTFFLGRWCHHV